jgi:hypothetical protein
MSARLSNALTTLLAILIAVVTSWQGFSLAPTATSPVPMVCKCCGGKHGKCQTPACCARPADNHAPFAPASLPTPSQNEWHALAASTGFLLMLPLPSSNDLPATTILPASFTALPIFQRDCCYLI